MNGEKSKKLLCFKFNQDYSCFVCSNEQGFGIYSCNPYEKIYNNNIGGGLRIIEMYYRSNIMAFIGGGINPKYPHTKITLWNDEQKKMTGELCFKLKVVGVRIRKDMLVAVLERDVYVYNYNDFDLLETFATVENTNGCCDLTGVGPAILAIPDKNHGRLIIKNYETKEKFTPIANKHGIAAIALNRDGKLCAVGSKKGTLIRIFTTSNGNLLQEVRRGKDPANITSIAFDSTSSWFACTSNKGTVHIFSVISPSKAAVIISEQERSEQQLEEKGSDEEDNEEEKKVHMKNRISRFRFVGGIIPYFKSEWSVAQFRITEKNTVVGFGPPETNTIIVLTSTGKYYVAEYDPVNGGECKKIDEKVIEMPKVE